MPRKGFFVSPDDGGDVTDLMIQYETGKMEQEEMVKFFQRLIDIGLIQFLRGSYKSMAEYLIEEGYCTQKED